MPVQIGIRHSEYRKATLSACTAVRQAYLHDHNDIILDFSKTRKIEAPGMLLFVAEVDRAIRMGRPDQIVRCKLPVADEEESRIVRQVLDQIGFLNRIGQSPPPSAGGDTHYHESVRHWRYATGTRVDEEPGDVLDEHEGRIAPALMQSMQIGVAEALINSLHHAYNGDRGDGCARSPERRWWMFTRELDGRLEVLVCDLGIGIPRSLPLTWDKWILKRIGAMFDASPPEVAAIRMALILGKSSTGDEHRGKGLPQIWNATRVSNDGSVGIHSGKAYVGYDTESGTEAQSQFSGSIRGTLISWSFPVQVAGGSHG